MYTEAKSSLSRLIRPSLAVAALFFSGCGQETNNASGPDHTTRVVTTDTAVPETMATTSLPETALTPHVTESEVTTTDPTIVETTVPTTVIQTTSTTIPPTTTEIPTTTTSEAEPVVPELHFVGEFDCGGETWSFKYDDDGYSYAVAPDGTVHPLVERGFIRRDLQFFEDLKNVENPRIIKDAQDNICSGD